MYALMQAMINVKDATPIEIEDRKKQVEALDELRMRFAVAFEDTLKSLIRPDHEESLNRMIHAYPGSHSLRRMYQYSKFYEKAERLIL